MGNSEVGHNAMGAGRVIDQGAKLVEEALASGSRCWTAGLAGVVSPPPRHPALHRPLSATATSTATSTTCTPCSRAAAAPVPPRAVHALTDGRDVSAALRPHRRPSWRPWPRLPASGVDARGRLRRRAHAHHHGPLRGRLAMVAARLGLPTCGRTPVRSAVEAVEDLYAETRAVDDHGCPPSSSPRTPVGPIVDGDGVILFNFRGDRAIELTAAFDAEPEFPHFDRGRCPAVTLRRHDAVRRRRALPKRHFLVAPPVIDDTVGAASPPPACQPRHLRDAEVRPRDLLLQRQPQRPSPARAYVEVPSDNRPFEQTPWMKAAEITDAAHRRAGAKAAGTTSGSTTPTATWSATPADLAATRIAVEAVDASSSRALEAGRVRASAGVVLI
jgi:2,3-bisphosphoglycerate-independent phosphoglycerate mutase